MALRHHLARLLEPLVKTALPAVHLRGVHRILPADLFPGHPGLPLLQHRQFLIAAPLSTSATTRLDRFHRCVHVSLLTYDTCLQFKRGTTLWSSPILPFEKLLIAT